MATSQRDLRRELADSQGHIRHELATSQGQVRHELAASQRQIAHIGWGLVGALLAALTALSLALA